jgi:hypothetical protein
MSGLAGTMIKEKNGKTEEKIIFHIDVNSAFLSWSAVKRLREEPGSVDLRTIPAVQSAVDDHPDRGGSGITVVTFGI